MKNYEQLWEMPCPVLKHRRMEVAHRAKQFAPFAALKGFDRAIQSQDRILEDKYRREYGEDDGMEETA